MATISTGTLTIASRVEPLPHVWNHCLMSLPHIPPIHVYMYIQPTHSKGDYDGAIEQYILTIGKLEPSYVIRKVGVRVSLATVTMTTASQFLDAQRIHNLTAYLKVRGRRRGRGRGRKRGREGGRARGGEGGDGEREGGYW